MAGIFVAVLDHTLVAILVSGIDDYEIRWL